MKVIVINGTENHDIPDFWDECSEKNLLGSICNLRPEGKRDLYGLCTPTKEEEDTFEYGIGVLVDEQTADFDVAEMEKAGFCVWDVKPGTYVVFDCIGEDGDCIGETWENSIKNSCHRWDMRQSRKQTMRFTSKREEKV